MSHRMMYSFPPSRWRSGLMEWRANYCRRCNERVEYPHMELYSPCNPPCRVCRHRLSNDWPHDVCGVCDPTLTTK